MVKITDSTNFNTKLKTLDQLKDGTDLRLLKKLISLEVDAASDPNMKTDEMKKM
jgi:hypothetical protein